MAKMAEPFLENSTIPTKINPWLQQLKSFRTSPPGKLFNWTIPKDRPVTTKESTGGYEPGGRGRYTVHATMCSIWQISIPNITGQAQKKGQPQANFVLSGKASTRISIFSYDQGNRSELARWRFEIGNNDSPGCHFHAQVMGEEGDIVFPKSMSVPRLPNLLFTPMDAIEFVLAEIFQDRWKEHASKETDAIRGWAGCQKRRLINLLKWQQDRLAKNAGSPWTSLKAEKPHAKLMIDA